MTDTHRPMFSTGVEDGMVSIECDPMRCDPAHARRLAGHIMLMAHKAEARAAPEALVTYPPEGNFASITYNVQRGSEPGAA